MTLFRSEWQYCFLGSQPRSSSATFPTRRPARTSGRSLRAPALTSTNVTRSGLLMNMMEKKWPNFRLRERDLGLLMLPLAKASRRSTGAWPGLPYCHSVKNWLQRVHFIEWTIEHLPIRAIRQLDGYYLQNKTLNIEIRWENTRKLSSFVTNSPNLFFFYSDDRAKKSKQEEEYYGLAQTYGYSPEDLGVDSGRGFGRGRGGRGGGRQAPYPMGGRGGFGGGQGGYQTTHFSYLK